MSILGIIDSSKSAVSFSSTTGPMPESLLLLLRSSTTNVYVHSRSSVHWYQKLITEFFWWHRSLLMEPRPPVPPARPSPSPTSLWPLSLSPRSPVPPALELWRSTGRRPMLMPSGVLPAGLRRLPLETPGENWLTLTDSRSWFSRSRGDTKSERPTLSSGRRRHKRTVWGNEISPSLVTCLQIFHAHFFEALREREIGLLLNGILPAWARIGREFCCTISFPK